MRSLADGDKSVEMAFFREGDDSKEMWASELGGRKSEEGQLELTLLILTLQRAGLFHVFEGKVAPYTRRNTLYMVYTAARRYGRRDQLTSAKIRLVASKEGRLCFGAAATMRERISVGREGARLRSSVAKVGFGFDSLLMRRKRGRGGKRPSLRTHSSRDCCFSSEQRNQLVKVRRRYSFG